MAKTSLERSHSKVSNFKLTMISLLGALSVGIIFVSVAFLKTYQNYAIIGIAIGTILFLLTAMLLNKFAR